MNILKRWDSTPARQRENILNEIVKRAQAKRLTPEYTALIKQEELHIWLFQRVKNGITLQILVENADTAWELKYLEENLHLAQKWSQETKWQALEKYLHLRPDSFRRGEEFKFPSPHDKVINTLEPRLFESLKNLEFNPELEHLYNSCLKAASFRIYLRTIITLLNSNKVERTKYGSLIYKGEVLETRRGNGYIMAFLNGMNKEILWALKNESDLFSAGQRKK